MKLMLPRQTLRAAVAFSAVVIFVLTPVVRADTVSVSDPKDSVGRFDIVEIGHAHVTKQGTGQTLIRHRVRTEQPWSFDALAGFNRFEFMFNLDDDHTAERRLTVYAEADGTPVAQVDNPNTGHIFGYAKVWKKRPRILLVEFPRRLLRRNLTRYSWYVTSVFHREDHPDCGTTGDVVVLCADRAPDRGWVEHEAVGP